jgi:group I intron endonuclease
MKISGIYKIINKVNDKYYVGSSNDIFGQQGRWKEHINGLDANRHENNYLQNAWNKYGSNNFEFIIVEKIEPIKEKLLETEQKYLDIAKKDGKEKCYNLAFIATGGAGFTGHKHSKKSIEKMKQSHLGKYDGDKNPNYGKIPTIITRERISKALKGKYCGIKSWRYGKHHTKEAKEKNRIKHQNSNIFNIKNIKTGETFSGTRCEFIKRFNIHHIHRLIDKKLKTCGGWVLLD